MRILRVAPKEGDFICRGASFPKDKCFEMESVKIDSAELPRVEIRGKEHHHLVNVLRVTPGQQVELRLPSETAIWKTVVIHTDENVVELEVTASILPPPTPSIHLLVGNIRPQKSEFLVEQCSAVGVSKIYFFQAQRSQGQFKFDEKDPKFIRLNKIADSSLKQSGFTTTCEIRAFPSLNDTLEQIELPATTMRFVLVPPDHSITERSENIISHPSLRNAILAQFDKSIQKTLEPSTYPADSILIIGPEGGLSDQEITASIERGFGPVSIGLKTLRTETAALAASLLLSVVCSQA